jgi:hypothetical protein
VNFTLRPRQVVNPSTGEAFAAAPHATPEVGQYPVITQASEGASEK